MNSEFRRKWYNNGDNRCEMYDSIGNSSSIVHGGGGGGVLFS